MFPLHLHGVLELPGIEASAEFGMDTMCQEYHANVSSRFR